MDIMDAIATYSKNHGASVAQFERLAGVPKGTIYNISSGRSKHPRTDTMSKIAMALERIEADKFRVIAKKNSNIQDKYQHSHLQSHISPITANKTTSTHQTDSSMLEDRTSWNISLYLDAAQCVTDEMNKIQITIPKHKILEIIDEVYNYSTKSGLKLADRNFARWILDK